MKSTFSRDTFNKNNLGRLTRGNGRKVALGVAGLAFVGAGIGGPVAAFAGGESPAPQGSTVAVAGKVAKGAPAASAPVPIDKGAPGGKALQYDYKRQPNFYYCGPAATRIALTAIGQTPSQDDVAKKLGTTTDGTNSAVDITSALNKIAGGHSYKTYEISGDRASGHDMDKLRANVVHAVSNGHAVVANIAGTVTDSSGDVHSYEGGHYLTVVGYDHGGMDVKIADPADDKGDGSYWLPVAKLANWIATRGYSA